MRGIVPGSLLMCRLAAFSERVSSVRVKFSVMIVVWLRVIEVYRGLLWVWQHFADWRVVGAWSPEVVCRTSHGAPYLAAAFFEVVHFLHVAVLVVDVELLEVFKAVHDKFYWIVHGCCVLIVVVCVKVKVKVKVPSFSGAKVAIFILMYKRAERWRNVWGALGEQRGI